MGGYLPVSNLHRSRRPECASLAECGVSMWAVGWGGLGVLCVENLQG